MTFLLTSVDETGQIREFSGHVKELEQGLDLANKIVAMGHVLLRVRLREGDMRMDLPLEAFTGQPISGKLRQLEQQWQAILQPPESQREAIRHTHRRTLELQLSLCQERIVSYELVISQLTQLLWQTQQLKKVHSQGLIQRYEAILSRYDKQLEGVYLLRHRWQQRLDQLGPGEAEG